MPLPRVWIACEGNEKLTVLGSAPKHHPVKLINPFEFLQNAAKLAANLVIEMAVTHER